MEKPELSGGISVRPLVGKGLLIPIILILLLGLKLDTAFASTSMRGIVVDGDGLPIMGAEVSIWVGRELVASGTTGVDGYFDIPVREDRRYSVYVLADDEETPGVDYLPSRRDASPSDGELLFALSPAASLSLSGDIMFVESEELPYSIQYSVHLPGSDDALNPCGVPLIYGTTTESQSKTLGLAPSHLVVPTDTPLTVKINCSILIERGLTPRVLWIESVAPLVRGERRVIDVRRFTIAFNLGVAEHLEREVGSRIDEMESMGFYLTSEKRVVAEAGKSLSEARVLHEVGDYKESFTLAKRGYLLLRQTLNDLTGMARDAATSIYIIIFFLAFSSTSVAFLIFEKEASKLLGSLGAYILSLTVFYIIYPGSSMISSTIFLKSAAFAAAASLVTALLIPRVLKGRGWEEHLPVRNIIIPIFSIAKRNIKRRRLRFTLTFISISVLVLSFVSLTSIYQGYGLITVRLPGWGASQRGVMIRSSTYTEESPAFIPLADVASGWLERQPESMRVSPKAENLPLNRPVVYLNKRPIYGVVGVKPEDELSIVDLKGIILEGGLPSEGEIMISGSLRRELRVELGESLELSGMRVRLGGTFDDEALRRLKDLDAGPYAPKKLVNISPEGEAPRYVVSPCEANEIVFTHLSTALQIPLVGIMRVGIAVEEGVDAHSYAARLALERGYIAWSSSPEGLYLSRLGGYLEGRGLPLIVPWIIVVLNVLVTTLNSIYERRREIHILSSVGLNPAHIAGVFMAEASIIGLSAGGVGYLCGLGFYRVMALLNIGLEVRQKISAAWSLASIGVAMATIIMGVLVALRGSVIITPSLMRRWRIEREKAGFEEPWELVIPIKLQPEEVGDFMEFAAESLMSRENDPTMRTSSIKLLRGPEGAINQISFVYRATQGWGDFYTRNTLTAVREPEGVRIILRTHGERSWAHTSGTLVRFIAMEWSTVRGRR
ncbi:MAG: FtsX-like permease family protein [Candidatus Bathyarchaeia archaeon]